MNFSSTNEYLRSIFCLIFYLRPYKFNGVKAIPRRGTHDFCMLFVPREANLRSHFKMYPGETFVDVGAVVGSYTLMVAEEYKTKGVKVIAVEDHPENYKALCKNVECNNFKNIKTVSKAVSDTKGNVTMYKQNDTQRSRSGQYTSLFNALVTSNGTPCELECDTLDDIIGNDGADLMKLDIEGAEVLALKGATNSLKRLRKIIVEVHGNNFEKVKHILEIHQFKLGFITSIEGMSYIIGSK